MAVYRTYECPECLKNFDFLHHPNDEPPPSFCPLCGANVSGEKKRRARAVTRIKSPNIGPPRSGKPRVSKSVDSVYNQMVSASEVRQEQAAEMLGVDRSSLSDMKMTDMKDNLRAGDFSHAPAAAAKIMGGAVDVDGMKMTFQDNAQGAEYARAVSQGPDPNVGSRMMDMIGSKHSQLSRQLVANGQQNRKSR